MLQHEAAASTDHRHQDGPLCGWDASCHSLTHEPSEESLLPSKVYSPNFDGDSSAHLPAQIADEPRAEGRDPDEASGGEGVDVADDDDVVVVADVPDDEAVHAAALCQRKALRKLLRGCKCFFESIPREVVLVHAKEMGFEVVRKADLADIIWGEATPLSAADVALLKSHQRINSFPGMKIISTKCVFGKIVETARAIFADGQLLSTVSSKACRGVGRVLDAFPRTFVIPGDRQQLQEMHNSATSTKACGMLRSARPIYVVKPDGGCGGDGIYLTNDVLDIRHQECVVQEYVSNPLLLAGLKFDVRLYVLVTSLEPLRYAIYREGLARLAVDPYEQPNKKNFHKLNMHLTNYSLNKFASNFVPNERSDDDASSSKRTLSTAFAQLRNSNPNFSETSFWEQCTELVEASLLLILPFLQLHGRTAEITSRCFQLLGFDVLIDEAMQLHLLEINHHPSLQTDAPVDMKVKGDLLKRVIRMMSFKAVAQTTKKKKRRLLNTQFAGLACGSETVGDTKVEPLTTLCELASWEREMSGGDSFKVCEVEDLTSCALGNAWVRPLQTIREVFIAGSGVAGGSKAYGAMGSTRLVRFARKWGIIAGRESLPNAVPTSSVDLLFISYAIGGSGGGLDFMGFLQLLLNEFGDVIAPVTPRGSIVRLDAVARFFSAASLRELESR